MREEQLIKAAFSQTCYGRWNIDGRERRTLCKAGVSQTCYGRRNIDGRERRTEDEYNRKLNKIIERIKTHLLPYVEALSYKDSALEKAIGLEKRSLLFFEYVIPIMYCVWKHDKKAALDYLEERGMRLRKLVKPEEWDRLERTKKGEQFMQYERPINALAYEEYIEGSKKIREWIESQEYDD